MKAAQSFLCARGRRSHRVLQSTGVHAHTSPRSLLPPACCLLDVAFTPNASSAHEPSDQTDFFPLCSQTPPIYWNQMHLFPQELPRRDGWAPSCNHRGGSSPLNPTLSEIGECSFPLLEVLSRHLLLSAARVALRVRSDALQTLPTSPGCV